MIHLSLPPGYQLRPASLQDFEAVLHLRTSQNLADYGETGLSEASLKANWFSRDFHVGQDHWVVTGPGDNLSAYGEVRGSGRSYQAIFAAAPGQWNDQVARALLDRIDTRAAELCPRPPYELTCRISDNNEAIQRLVESCGFRHTLTFHTMELNLATPPANPQWKRLEDQFGVSVRTFAPEQDEQITYQVDEEASQDKGYHRRLSFRAWSLRMGLYDSKFDPSLWFLAVDPDQVIGVCLNFYEAETRTGWIDHLGVRRAWRKKGIGIALLLEAVNAFYQRGYARARLNVDSLSLTNAVSLYLDVGFKKVQGYHVYQK